MRCCTRTPGFHYPYRRVRPPHRKYQEQRHIGAGAAPYDLLIWIIERKRHANWRAFVEQGIIAQTIMSVN